MEMNNLWMIEEPEECRLPCCTLLEDQVKDEVVRGTPNLWDFIYPIKRSIRELRDGKQK
jgi:hypothetical protein